MPRGYTKTCPKCHTPLFHNSKRCKVCEPVNDRYNIPCPRCGQMMNRKSTGLCWNCYSQKRKDEARNEFHPCKCCGKEITIADTYCISCKSSTERDKPRRKSSHINPDSLSKEWLIGFVGLFCGEGTATVHVTNKDTYSGRLSLVLREDDREVMYDIQNHLGGLIRIDDKPGRNPCLRWEVNRHSQVKQICYLIIENSILPCKKIKEVELTLKFCEWRENQRFHDPDWSIAASIRDEILRIRAYNGI